MPRATAHRRRATGLALVPPLVSTLATAALVWLGTGLHPHPWLTWLVPLPLFLAGPRMAGRAVAAAGFVGYAVGELGLAAYAVRLIGVPVPIAAGFVIVQAGVFALVVATFRALVLRGRPAWAVLGVAALAAGADFLQGLVSPHGVFLSPAVTQADLLPVLHVAAVTGNAGIVALLTAVPAVVAASVHLSGPQRRAALVAGAAVLVAGAVASLGGGLALRPGPAVPVAVAVPAVPTADPPELDSRAGRAVLASMLDAVDQARAAGAEVLVLAEASVVVDDVGRASVLEAIHGAADGAVTVLVGMGHVEADGTRRNEAVLVDRAGGAHEYWKRHPIPGVEDVVPGDRPLIVQDGDHTWGVAICKDLDFPSLLRDYRGVDALLVPAWDVPEDGWLHSRLATVDATAQGLSVLRPARGGLLTVADGTGRFVAEAPAGDGRTVLTSDVRLAGGGTPYGRLGDWFGWLCVAGAAATLTGAWRRQPTPPQPPGPVDPAVLRVG